MKAINEDLRFSKAPVVCGYIQVFLFLFFRPFLFFAILRVTFVGLSVTSVAAREINEMRSALVC